MKSGKTILQKKISAFALLLIMLFATVIKISHTHPAVNISFDTKKSNTRNLNLSLIYESNADTKCIFCEYQLVKDADFKLLVFNQLTVSNFSVINPAKFTFTILQVFSLSETRGPPQSFC